MTIVVRDKVLTDTATSLQDRLLTLYAGREYKRNDASCQMGCLAHRMSARVWSQRAPRAIMGRLRQHLRCLH